MKGMLLIILVCLVASGAFAQIKNGFTIKGKLKDLEDDTWLYLIRNNGSGSADTVSIAKSKSMKFSFRGRALVEGEAYFIKIDTVKTKYNKNINGHITVLVENKKINIDGSIWDLKVQNLKVTGSKMHNEFIGFLDETVPIITRTNNLGNEIYKLKGEPNFDTTMILMLEKKLDSAKEIFPIARRKWIANHPNSYLSPWLIPQAFSAEKDTAWLFKSYNSLTERAKKGKYGVDLKEYIEMISNTSIGSLAPDLLLSSPDGAKISLKEIVNKSEVTLIDFWASWCKPCRAAFPGMKSIYEQYHNKGLNILGVSTDHSADNWKAAIIADSIPWLNIRDENRLAAKLYGVTAIPASFLLDKNGQIVAKWTGENKELHKILSEILLNNGQ